MSIQVNELRIGNWVMVSDNYRKNDIIQVSSINVSGIELGGDHYGEAEPGYYSSMIDPIILTSELLEKCGFIPEEYDSQDGRTREWNKDNSFVIEQPLKSGEVFLFCHHDYTRVFYVHQLQNLYFALTGQELSATL